MSSNPFDRMPKANLDADRRRQRRALTTDELHRLIQAAQTAPERPPTRRKEAKGIRPPQRLSGAERAEVYAILAGTGLRIGELEQLTVADFRLDDPVPHIALPARVTKNGEDDTIPLRADLVDLLRRRVAGRAPTSILFEIPGDLIKRFNADCRRAGIPKRDERGPHGRHPCIEDDVRHLARPVGRRPPDRASPHAALGHQTDDVGLHRP